MQKNDLSAGFIQHYTPGEKATGFFIIRKKECKTKKDGTPYLLFELGDVSGRINATLWENVQAAAEKLQTGDIVKVQGTVMEYNDSRQISIDRIRRAEDKDGVQPKDFLRSATVDAEVLFFRLMETVASIHSTPLRNLLENLFADPVFQSQLKEAPGGKLWHHAYLGGLLEHTLSVAAICDHLCGLYPDLNRGLLMAGAVLHDIGKVTEYDWDRGFIDYSDEGRLWGHISMGAQKVKSEIEKIESVDGFPAELKKQLIHLLLSHQGKLEQGSPVPPMTREAMALYYADELDSKLNALSHIIERDREPGKKWSKYIQLLDRFIYFGEENSKIKDQ